MNDTFIELTSYLITELQKFIEYNNTYDYNKQIKHYQENSNDSNEMKLQKQETWFDQISEKYLKIEELYHFGKKMKKNVKKYFKMIDEMINTLNKQKCTIGNQMNEILMEHMKQIENELKKEIFTKEYEDLNYEKCVVEKEEWKRKQIEKLKKEESEKKIQIFENILTRNEMDLIEKEIGRKLEFNIFDSNINNWKKDNSQLFQTIQNQSEIIILIETIDKMKFGCYVSSEINDQKRYIEDSNAFIFKFENDNLEKYSIVENENVLKICGESDEDLFVIGKNDIVIKKYEKKDKCSFKQTSFDSNKKKNVLIGKNEIFEIKSIHFISTLSEEQQNQRRERYSDHQLKDIINFDQFIQLEDWTNLQCNEILFDSNFNNWEEDLSEFNDRIIGKGNLMFLIEDENNEQFGYHLNTEIEKKYDEFIKTNYKSFHFNLKSNNNRLRNCLKFEIIENEVGYWLFNDIDSRLIAFGDIVLFKENLKNKSYCTQTENWFDYHGIENALCGKEGLNDCFIPKRIVVIKMI